jgi:hypothetical protein
MFVNVLFLISSNSILSYFQSYPEPMFVNVLFLIPSNSILSYFQSDPEVSEIINESMININRDLSQDPKLQYLIPKLEGFREKMNHVFAT